MNYMKLDTDKCHLFISGKENVLAKLENDIVWESIDMELLRVTIENNLRFDKYVSNIF